MVATTKKNILHRINDAMKELKYVRKTAQVSGGGTYMAVTHDEVTRKVHPMLAKHGIIVVPELIKDKMKASGMVTSNGNTIFLYQCVYDIHFYGIDSMVEKVTARVSAHANDMSDKAAGKAISYAVKNAYLKVFALETGENDEERVEGNVSPLSEEQVQTLRDYCEELGFPVAETLNSLATKVFRQEKIEDLGSNLFDNAMKRLKKKAADANRDKKPADKKSTTKKAATKKKAAPKQAKAATTEIDDPFGEDS